MTLVVIPEECQSMPMTAPKIEPEGVGEAPQEFVAAIFVDDGLGNHAPERRHPG